MALATTGRFIVRLSSTVTAILLLYCSLVSGCVQQDFPKGGRGMQQSLECPRFRGGFAVRKIEVRGDMTSRVGGVHGADSMGEWERT